MTDHVVNVEQAEDGDGRAGDGMARLLFKGADAETEREAIDAVRDVFEAYEQQDGIWLGSAAWLVAATRV